MTKHAFGQENRIRPGMDIVMTKWIALEGTVKIAEAKEEELKKRLPGHLIETAKQFLQYVPIEREIKLASRYGVSVMHPLSEGGIFSGLWRMAEASKVGLEIELRTIPVRQETIEICECFRVNPYLLLSDGAVLMAACNGYDLARFLQKEGIVSTVIGKATDSNDRILLNEEERRFLDRPQKEELEKLLGL